MAAKTLLSIYQGDDYAASVVVMQADGVTPADLTGFTAQSQIRTSVDDDPPIAEFIVSITDNIISMSLTHEITKALEQSSYAWDLQIIDATGWITTLLYGLVQVTREVTQVYAARQA